MSYSSDVEQMLTLNETKSENITMSNRSIFLFPK